jgi:hypothetical protein
MSAAELQPCIMHCVVSDIPTLYFVSNPILLFLLTLRENTERQTFSKYSN